MSPPFPPTKKSGKPKPPGCSPIFRHELRIYPMKFLRPGFLLTILLFLGAAYLLIVFNLSYSEGSRAGYIQKFSQKGWACKTYEGELAMTTVPGVMANS